MACNPDPHDTTWCNISIKKPCIYIIYKQLQTHTNTILHSFNILQYHLDSIYNGHQQGTIPVKQTTNTNTPVGSSQHLEELLSTATCGH